MESVFEVIMLLCFGSAWPFSIYKSYISKSVAGKSAQFLVILMVGYVAGIMHKLFYSFDWVIILYGLNLFMISIDLALYMRNKKRTQI